MAVRTSSQLLKIDVPAVSTQKWIASQELPVVRVTLFNKTGDLFISTDADSVKDLGLELSPFTTSNNKIVLQRNSPGFNDCWYFYSDSGATVIVLIEFEVK